MSRFCTNCGSAVSDGEKFCGVCGTAVPAAPVPSNDQPVFFEELSVMSSPESKPEQKRRPVWPFVLIIMLLLVVVGVLLFVMFDPLDLFDSPRRSDRSADDDDDTAQTTLQEDDTTTLYETTLTTVYVETVQTTAPTTTVMTTTTTTAPTTTTTTVVSASRDFILPHSSSTLLTQSEIEALNDWELMIAINEIYARNGRIFKDDDVKTYFAAQSWYRGYIQPENFTDSMLSEIELANVQLMYAEKQSRR